MVVGFLVVSGLFDKDIYFTNFIIMKELAAYLLLVLAGKEGIAAADVSGVITAAGGEADEEKINSLITELDGKDIHELLAKGDKELKSVVGAAVAAGKFLIRYCCYVYYYLIIK